MMKLSEAHKAKSSNKTLKDFKISAYKITPNANVEDSDSEMVSGPYTNVPL